MATEIRIPEATVDLHAILTVAVVRIHVVILIVIVVDTVLVPDRGAVRTASRDTLAPSPGLILEVVAAVREVRGTEANGELLATAIIRSPTDAWAFSDSAFTRPNVKFATYSRSTATSKAFK